MDLDVANEINVDSHYDVDAGDDAAEVHYERLVLQKIQQTPRKLCVRACRRNNILLHIRLLFIGVNLDKKMRGANLYPFPLL